MVGENFEVLPTPIKSVSDKKKYKAIKLENQLVATIISDKSLIQTNQELESEESEEKLAAVALHIEVGSFGDPIEVPGMSHFLEHMVFMGSEKFPEENDFDSFIKKSGGWSNAYTDYEGTMFFFACLEKHLPDALDKFSQFFIAPLMKKDALTREREAVDSEFQMALPNDEVRKDQVLLSFAKKDSPVYRSFSWGNLKTLRDNITDDKLYEGVHEYHKRHYSSHRMSLAIQARLSVDTLQDLTIKYFSEIKNNNLPLPDFSAYKNGVFDTPDFNKIYYIKPINETIDLNLTWSLPSFKYEYKSKSLDYIFNLICNEEKGSILSYLKKHMLAVSLSAGHCGNSYDNNCMYTLVNIHLQLSEEGLKHLYKIVKIIFSYINLLKSVGPQKRIYDELQLIADTHFKFEQEMLASTMTRGLASSMHIYPSMDIIRGDRIYYEYNPDQITKILNLLTARKVNITVTSKKLPDGLKFDKTEKWFGTEYTDIEIPEDLYIKWETVAPYLELGLPGSNPYLPNNISILPETSDNPNYPEKIIDSPKCELWYKQDQKFKLPKASYSFFLVNSVSVDSSKSSALLDMFVHLLNFTVGEDAYPARVAHLSYYLFRHNNGISVEVSGYDDKLPLLIDVIAKCITNLCDFINPEMFKAVKDNMLKKYYNKFFRVPSLSSEILNDLLVDHYFSPLIKYNELLKLTFEDMYPFSKTYCDNLYVKALVQGNVSIEKARGTVNKLLENLNFNEIPNKQYLKNNTLEIPVGEQCLLAESFNKTNPNCVTRNYYQIGPYTLKDSVVMDIIMRIIEEPAFNVLRTNEQLGYGVYCTGGRSHKILGYSLVVYSQTTKFSTEYLDTRIDEFLKHTHKIVEEITVDGFEKIKANLIKTKKCCHNNLHDEVEDYWYEISSGTYVFDRNKQEIEMIKDITLDDVSTWWLKYNHFGNQEHFRKISIQVTSGHMQNNDAEKIENDVKDTTLKILGNKKNVPKEKRDDYFIEDIGKFKASLSRCFKNEQ